MTMQLEKAQIIVGNWRKNGFRAGKTLKELGYSVSVANKKPAEVINRALKTIAKHEAKAILESNNPKKTILQMVGINEVELMDHYRSVIQQDRDLSNKLKALMPLLAEFGIRFDHTDRSIATVPILNLTVTKRGGCQFD